MRAAKKSAVQAARVHSGRHAEDAVELINLAIALTDGDVLWRAHVGYRGGRPALSQGPDFYGILRDGRFVYVEVKSLSGAKALALPSPRGAIRLVRGAFTETEIERLDACDDRGGVAIVLALIVFGPTTTWCPIPWAAIRATHARSLKIKDLLPRACAPRSYLARALLELQGR